MEMLNRTCTKCGQQKDANQFGRNKGLKGGITYWCLECWRKYNAEYRQTNRERIRERNRQYSIKYYKARKASRMAAREKSAMEYESHP